MFYFLLKTCALIKCTLYMYAMSCKVPFLLQIVFSQPRHWRALFIGMGQDYDPSWEFTVANLLSFNLGRYKDLIATVCAGAAAEYALELQLNQLVRTWQEKDFKLAKHIPLMRPRLVDDQRKSAKGKRKTKHAGTEVWTLHCI